MKKFLLSATLIMGLAASLCACGSKKDDDETTAATTAGVQTVTDANDTTEAEAEADENTYEYYFSQPSFKEQFDAEMEKMLQQYAGTYSDITMEAKGNDITYNYTYDASIVPTDAEKEALESTDWSTPIKQVKANFAASTGFEPTSITYNFYLNDGTLFFTVSE